MSKNIDFSKMVILQKLDNTTTTGEKGNNSLFTSDYIKLNSYEEVKNIPENERIKTLTDFALMNYSWQSSLCDTARDKRAGAPWLRSAYSSNIVRFIDYDGSLGWDNVRARSLSLCPALYLNLESYISARSAGGGKIDILHKKIDKKTKHFINIGEYPKTKVPQNLFLELENQYQGGMLKPELQATGRLYTTNGQREYGEDFLSKQNPEFIYKGKKYVRVIVWNDSKNHIYEDGTIVPKTGSVEWVKVEPVTFEIKNWEQLPKSINSKGKRFGADKYLELETEEAILSGLPFYPTYDHDNCSMWQNSLVRAFLNSANSKQIDGNSQYKAEYQWDFTNSGFLQQALNLTREPTVEYIIPDNEHEICAHAFEGCIGINKIYIPSHVTKLGDYAFAGLNNTQICFETGTKQISNIENAFLDKHYTNINSYMYIYLSKDKKHVTISHQIDQKLENGSYRLDFSIEQLKKVFNTNFRQNYVQLKTWKQNGNIKFIPPEYTMLVFPASQMKKYFINNNNQRWGRLVKTLKFDTLEGTEKNNSLIDLMKIFYAIGGFSENQGECERAYNYVLNYIAKTKNQNTSPSELGAEIHSRFSKMTLKDEYNPNFAKFFMKYYHENPDFMNFRLRDKDGDLMDSQDYLCSAHNAFDRILKNYPNRVVNGNEERALLSPRFVAEHCSIIEYDDIEEGNEILAEIVGKYGYDQDQFDEIQEIYEKAKKLKDSYIIRADKSDEKSCVKFRVLEKDDPLGFVLGDITNCCQVLGGAGEECVDDGYTNPNAGFLVFEESVLNEQGAPTGEVRILGQAYIWYDPQTKTVCYDNIEIPTKVLNELRSADKQGRRISAKALVDAVEESAVAIMTAMNKDGIKVERVTTGEGYNDLKRELSQRFERESNPKARHRNYAGYSDARNAQYIIKTYAEVTKTNSVAIRKSIEESRQTLEQIQQAVSQITR